MTEPLRAVPDDDELVTRAELARKMRVSVPTIDRLRRFRAAEAIAWADAQREREES